MQRLTISVTAQLARSFDRLIERKGYRNRSEAFRDLLRKALQEESVASGTATHCTACVSYVYDDRQRLLANRIAEIRQRCGNLTVSTVRVPIDHAACMEILTLRGEIQSVVRLADAIVAATGVRHGHVNLIPIEVVSPATDALIYGCLPPTSAMHRYPRLAPTLAECDTEDEPEAA